MPLSPNMPIMASDISHFKEYKQLKVYLLTGQNDDKVVIKTDTIMDGQYQSANPIMTAIDPRAAVTVLGPGERGQLWIAIQQFEELCMEYQALGIVYSTQAERDAVSNLKQSLNFNLPFVKMEAHQLTQLDDAFEDRMQGDKTSLRALTATLVEPGGLEKLGAVAAADLFNGNTDRFFPGGGTKKTIGGVTLPLRSLVNIGNVFMVASGTGSMVSGLDFVDPQSRYKDINVPLVTAEQAADHPWPGRHLVDPKKRKSFAEDIAHDLECMVSPKRSTFSLKGPKLGRDAASRVERGLVQGAQQIRSALEMKYNPNRWTAGARDRYTLISQVR